MGGDAVLETPTWGEVALVLLALAALAVAGAFVWLVPRVAQVLREWSRLARETGEAVAGVREAAAGVEEAARGVKGAAAAVERAAGVAERRLEQLALGVESVNQAANHVSRATESVRFAMSVLEKTALPALIHMVGWRAGLAEGVSYLLKRGRRQKNG